MNILRPRITQSDIARLAGVSQPVVAAVLGGKTGRVRAGEETKQEILRLARELGYRPHRGAQLMRGARSGLIGVISTIPGSAIGAQRIYHLSLALEAAGLQTYMQHLVFGSNTVDQLFAQAVDAHVEGVIFLGLDEERAQRGRELAIAAGMPHIFALGAGSPSVNTDHAAGVRMLVRHALSLGHRHFLFESRISPSSSARCRLSGFRQSEADILASGGSCEIHTSEYCPLHFDQHEAGWALARKVLGGSGDGPDVVMCHNDHTALAFQLAVCRAGWRVPSDVAVTGFDNESVAAHALSPITTVALPQAEAAHAAVDELLSVIRGEAAQDSLSDKLLPCELVVRESCGAPSCGHDVGFLPSHIISETTPTPTNP